jgi:2-polyprenyl-3-methyl-5-hydroxy-6-metoxy-1,4-benzoquinol methylase
MVGPKKTSHFWDQRYGTEEYAYGKEANVFFSAQLAKIAPGHILFPGEGEGRNAVHAARQGWMVDAFDSSGAGQGKAMALASKHGVDINYQVCFLENFHFLPDQYDAIALLFFHADPADRYLKDFIRIS